jgi:hypothetical protein
MRRRLRLPPVQTIGGRTLVQLGTTFVEMTRAIAQRDTRMLLGVALAATALGGVAAYFGGHSELRFAVALIVLISTTVGAIVYSFRTGEAFSVLSLSAFFYLLAYGAGSIYFLWLMQDFPTTPAELLHLEPLRPFEPDALVLATIAWLMFCAGYLAFRIPRSVRISRVLPSLPPPVVIIVALLVFGWIARIALIGSGRYFHTVVGGEVTSTETSWFTFAFSSLPLIATALTGASALRTRPERRRLVTIAFWALFLIELAWAIPTAERGQVVGLIILAGVVRYYSSGRRLGAVPVAVAAAFLILVVFPVVLAYRAQRGYQDDPQKALVTAADRTLTPQPIELSKQGIAATFSRFSDVTSLAAIKGSGRELFGREPGETVSWAGQAFIPRFLAPDKVDPGTFGNEFGRTYTIIAANDYGSSISATQVGEAYLNFGMLGLFVMMPLLGGAYRFLNDLLAERRTEPVVLAFYAALAWPLISSQETIMANGLTGIIKLLMVFTAVVAAVSVAYSYATTVRRTRTPAEAAATP